MRSVQSRVLASGALLSLTLIFACSSTSDSSNPNGASGNSGSSVGGTSAHAGTSSAAGSTAQAGSNAQGGASAGNAGTSAAGSAGSAGSVAQAGSAGTSADGCASALLCDDFEKYTTGMPPGSPWTNNANGGTVTVDATHVHSGTHAVKFAAALSTDANSYRSLMINLQNSMLLPTMDNVVYGRMMFFLDSAPTMSVHWTFIDGQGKVPGQNYHSVYRYGGQLPITNGADFVGSQLMANYDTPDSYATPAVGPSSDCWLHSDKVVVPVGAWACAEWKFDGAANKMQFWLNGSEVTSLAMNGTGQGCVHEDATFAWSAPSFDRIDLGFESYQADDARNLWIDDVAIGTQK
ncbi:MAG TPA: hypothetical protein VGM44_11855, partial [Polyangiaceae bacterium]